MTPAPLPALTADVWGSIARAALAAEGSTMEARRCLSLVSRMWRDGLRGVHPVPSGQHASACVMLQDAMLPMQILNYWKGSHPLTALRDCLLVLLHH